MDAQHAANHIFDEAEIRVASLASVTQSSSESRMGPTTTFSSMCVYVFDFVLTFTSGLRPRFLWFSIWTTVVVTMMTLVRQLRAQNGLLAAPSAVLFHARYAHAHHHLCSRGRAARRSRRTRTVGRCLLLFHRHGVGPCQLAGAMGKLGLQLGATTGTWVGRRTSLASHQKPCT